MKNKFKSLSLILALLLTLSMVFTACNTGSVSTPDIFTSEENSTVITEESSYEYTEELTEGKTEDYTEDTTDILDSTVEDSTATNDTTATEIPTSSQNESESISETEVATESNSEEQVSTEDMSAGGSEETSESVSEEATTLDSDMSAGFDINKIPAYSGEGYYVVNGNKPYFTEDEITTEAYESYGALDSLGRCTTAMACLGKELMPTGDRGSISSVKPTGWIQKQYSCIKTQDLYNRSHLIAWSLAGEDANKQNLITGTPYLNQENMTMFEDMVRDYIKETGNHVMYRVTPVFEGNNLVASGVLMEAYSVEDKGYAIEFCVYLYNVQPGVVIDYATGESHEEGKDPTEAPGDDNVIEGVEGVPEGTTFIINVSTKKYHKLDSKYVGNLTKNMQYTTLSEAELIEQGYVLCGNCASGKC